MTSYLSFIKRANIDPNERWFIKLDNKGLIREVKQVFDPEDYKTVKNRRELLTKEELIEKLENDLQVRKMSKDQTDCKSNT